MVAGHVLFLLAPVDKTRPTPGDYVQRREQSWQEMELAFCTGEAGTRNT